MRISFRSFAFDPQRRLLFRENTEVALPPRVLGVLETLLDRPGDVISRQELMDRVWKDAFVTDTSLAEAVSALRQALGDDPQSPAYIQTVHRRGYRFVAPVVSDVPAGGVDAVSATPETGDMSRLVPWMVAVFAILLAASAIWNGVRRNSIGPAPVTRFEVRPNDGSRFDDRAPAFAVAPDGRTIAWTGCDGASCGIFIRPIDRLDAVRIAGTDGAEAPFFSPDGRWIAFFADGKLKKTAVVGGSPIVLADAPVAGGGSWNAEGNIVFSGFPAGGLAITSEQGGEVASITTPRFNMSELRHAWPSWMPDNRAILFTVVASPVPGAPGQLAIKPVGSPSWRALRGGVSRAIPAAPGYLLVASGGDLQALTYNERMLSLSGASESIVDAVATANGVPQFAAGGGTLVTLRAPGASRTIDSRTIEWSDAPGRAIPNLARLAQLTLSADGRRAAGVIADVTGSDVWTADLATGALTRVTFGGTNASPSWAPNGTLVYATRTADAPFTISGLGAMHSDGHLFPVAVAADGRIAALQTMKDGHTSLLIAGPRSTTQTIVSGPFDVLSAAFSPDATWIAYEADETGRREIYVRRLDAPARTQVSTVGGERPSWSPDGRALFFHEGARFVRVPVEADGQPRADARAVVFEQPGARVIAATPQGRLLIERRPSSEAAGVVLQWLRELEQRLPLPVNPPR
jgi:DNA-binding winged helix-turn-helix (wHTH) protein/Tol biopolymer transport system component